MSGSSSSQAPATNKSGGSSPQAPAANMSGGSSPRAPATSIFGGSSSQARATNTSSGSSSRVPAANMSSGSSPQAPATGGSSSQAPATNTSSGATSQAPAANMSGDSTSTKRFAPFKLVFRPSQKPLRRPILYSIGAMQKWWASNGQTFRFNDLPSELREHILQFCIRRRTGYIDIFHGRLVEDLNNETEFEFFVSPQLGWKPKTGVYEIIGKLGKWAGLLRVSMSVRAMTLNLCFRGSIFFPKGFCVDANSVYTFRERVDGLANHPLVAEHNSIPLDDETFEKAEKYFMNPKLYPDLHRLGTYLHAVRKVCLRFSFPEFYVFFDVPTGVDRLDRHHDFSYLVFDQLPMLDELVFLLPNVYDERHDPLNKMPDVGRGKLWHATQPCPRLLSRVIYECIAEVTPSYHGELKVKHFVDAEEEKRFWGRRIQAQQEYEEYEETARHRAMLQDGELHNDDPWCRFQFGAGVGQGTDESFFPPKCLCQPPCMQAWLDVVYAETF